MTMEFAIPEGGEPGRKGSDVRLVGYDMLGWEISVLIDGRTEAATYPVTFDAAGLASGLHICRLTSGPLTESRKMLLLR